MKTPEEIKKALECCRTGRKCRGECPYDEPGVDIGDCIGLLSGDALSFIYQLEERIDTLMMQIRGDCGTCKHRNEHDTCRSCCDAEYGYHPKWEYEGLPEVASHEKPV